MLSTANRALKNGITEGLSMEDYLALYPHTIGKSDILAFMSSPLQSIYQGTTPKEYKRHFSIGSAFNDLLIDPERYGKYQTLPEINKRTNAGKAFYADLVANFGEEYLITKSDRLTVELMAYAAQEHPEYERMVLAPPANMKMLTQRKEATMLYTDPYGILLRGRPDVILTYSPTNRVRSHVIYDIKTTKDASLNSFARDFYNYGYWMQSALYSYILHRLEPMDVMPTCKIFAVETSAPYHVRCFEVDPVTIGYGHEIIDRVLKHMFKCAQQDAWPGFGKELETLRLPSWAERQTKDLMRLLRGTMHELANDTQATEGA